MHLNAPLQTTLRHSAPVCYSVPPLQQHCELSRPLSSVWNRKSPTPYPSKTVTASITIWKPIRSKKFHRTQKSIRSKGLQLNFFSTITSLVSYRPLCSWTYSEQSYKFTFSQWTPPYGSIFEQRNSIGGKHSKWSVFPINFLSLTNFYMVMLTFHEKQLYLFLAIITLQKSIRTRKFNRRQQNLIADKKVNLNVFSSIDFFVSRWIPYDNAYSRRYKRFSCSDWASTHVSRFESRDSFGDGNMNLNFFVRWNIL